MDEERIYIGTKIVKAIKMTRTQFYEKRGQPFPANEEDSHGYQVTYADGYVSWSPAGTFESCYRELSSQETGMIVSAVPSKEIVLDDDQPDQARMQPNS